MKDPFGQYSNDISHVILNVLCSRNTRLNSNNNLENFFMYTNDVIQAKIYATTQCNNMIFPNSDERYIAQSKTFDNFNA